MRRTMEGDPRLGNTCAGISTDHRAETIRADRSPPVFNRKKSRSRVVTDHSMMEATTPVPQPFALVANGLLASITR
jgi:hypothetical protein